MTGGADLVDEQQQRVAVAVEPHLADVLGVARGLALDPVLAARLRDQYVARRVASVRASASSSIQASISTSPVVASWTTAGTSPSALRLSSAAMAGSRVTGPLCQG